MVKKRTVEVPDGMEMTGIVVAPIGGFEPPPPANVVRYGVVDMGLDYQRGCKVEGWLDIELDEGIDTEQPFNESITAKNAVAFDIEITDANGKGWLLKWVRGDGQINSGLFVEFWSSGELRATETGLWMSIPGVSLQGRFAYRNAATVLNWDINGHGDNASLTDHTIYTGLVDETPGDDNVHSTQLWAQPGEYNRNTGLQVATR